MTIRSIASPTVTVGGIHELTRRWEPAGEPRADVLIVHGVSEHSGRYEHVGGWLADAGFAVEAFDLIGCGASGGRRADIEDWSLFGDQIEGHLVPLLDNGQPTVLMAQSMGGLMAAEYLASDRPQPDLAVLFAPALSGGARWQRIVAQVGSRLPVVSRLAIPSAVAGEDLSRDPAVGEAYFADPLVYTKGTVRFGQALFTAMDRVSAAVPAIEVPTLVLHGGADRVVPTRASEVFESVDVVERRVLPDLRHELFNEPEGESIVAEVVEWIDSRL